MIPMKKTDILTGAISEAERFLVRARQARQRLESDDMANITGSKEMAAAKRASMDLSRALVKVRKGE